MSNSEIENAAQTVINLFDGKPPSGLIVTDDFMLARPNAKQLAIVWRPWQSVLEMKARFGDVALVRLLFSPDANLAQFGRINIRGRINESRYFVTEYAATKNSLAVFKKNIVGRRLFATLDPDAVEYAKEESVA
jgi:hypothetical protein